MSRHVSEVAARACRFSVGDVTSFQFPLPRLTLDLNPRSMEHAKARLPTTAIKRVARLAVACSKRPAVRTFLKVESGDATKRGANSGVANVPVAV